MLTKKEIIEKLNHLKKRYSDEGVIIYALFGSYAKDSQDKYSDIDISYKLDYNKFSQKYQDGFSKLLRLRAIKEELEKEFKRKVDFVPYKEKFEESVYV